MLGDQEPNGMVKVFGRAARCSGCAGGVEPPFPFAMAFQPIVDVDAAKVFAYEALVRGLNGESAETVMSQVTAENLYKFDQSCRVLAITQAQRLGLVATGAMLSINIIPGAVYDPAACLQVTLKTARRVGFPIDKLIFEITEMEEVRDASHVMKIVDEYRRHGFRIAIDDFGAAYAGLNLLAELRVQILKLDRALIHELHRRPAARAIVGAMVTLCRRLGTEVVAEGVETVAEYRALRECGIRLMQGFLLARPAVDRLPGFVLPEELKLEVRLEAFESRNAVAYGMAHR